MLCLCVGLAQSTFHILLFSKTVKGSHLYVSEGFNLRFSGLLQSKCLSIWLYIKPSKPVIWRGPLLHCDISHFLGWLQQRGTAQATVGSSPPSHTVSACGSHGQHRFPWPVLLCAASLSRRCAPSISGSLCDILRVCVHCWRQPSVTKCWHICSDSSAGNKSSRAAVGWWGHRAADSPEASSGHGGSLYGHWGRPKTLRAAAQLETPEAWAGARVSDFSIALEGRREREPRGRTCKHSNSPPPALGTEHGGIKCSSE